MSSKYPLYIILLELTEQLQSRNLLLDLHWQRREDNQAADDLTNGKFEAFDVEKRIHPSLEALPWMVLPRLMVEAEALHSFVAQKKRERENCNFTGQTRKSKKHKKAQGLRVTDPW